MPGDIWHIESRDVFYLVLDVEIYHHRFVKTIHVMTLFMDPPVSQDYYLYKIPEHFQRKWKFEAHNHIQGSSWFDRASKLVLRPGVK